jgi:hypothetical protein
VTLLAKTSHSIENGGLMTGMTHHQTQLGDLAACFARQLHHFVNENHWQIVNHEPAEIF